MINLPSDEGKNHATEFIASLEKEDVQRLSWLLDVLRMIDGWCRINRIIGKYLIIGAITVLIVMSHGLDAIRNLAGFGGKH